MKTTVGIVGLGHLGFALYKGLENENFRILINNGSEIKTATKLSEKGIEKFKAASIEQLTKQSQIILLCIKSKDLEVVGSEISKNINASQSVVSFLAQTPLTEIERLFESNIVVAKAMTTLGVSEGKGVSAYQLPNLTKQNKALKVIELIKKVTAPNCLFTLNTEEEMQLFTVAVGCFPGIMAFWLSQLASSVSQKSGQSLGDYQKVLPVLLNSLSDLLQESGSPQFLEQRVSTKGGVTEAIINSLKESSVSEVLDKAIVAGLKKMKS